MARFPTARPQRTGPFPGGSARPDFGAPTRRAALAIGLFLAMAVPLTLSRHALAQDEADRAMQLVSFELHRSQQELQLDFLTRFQLPRVVEDALLKGVPLHFSAEASVFRARWYWRDARVARATRVWRLAWQPLTRTYRVSFGGLHQAFESLPEAMAALRGAVDWRIADLRQLEEGEDHYVEFRYRLDTDELPRPMQIGLAGQADWALSIERTEPVR